MQGCGLPCLDGLSQHLELAQVPSWSHLGCWYEHPWARGGGGGSKGRQLFVKDVDRTWTCWLGCLPVAYKVDCDIRKEGEWATNQGLSLPTCLVLHRHLVESKNCKFQPGLPGHQEGHFSKEVKWMKILYLTVCFSDSGSCKCRGWVCRVWWIVIEGGATHSVEAASYEAVYSRPGRICLINIFPALAVQEAQPEALRYLRYLLWYLPAGNMQTNKGPGFVNKICHEVS